MPTQARRAAARPTAHGRAAAAGGLGSAAAAARAAAAALGGAVQLGAGLGGCVPPGAPALADAQHLRARRDGPARLTALSRHRLPSVSNRGGALQS